jgi:hypothetical protein
MMKTHPGCSMTKPSLADKPKRTGGTSPTPIYDRLVTQAKDDPLHFQMGQVWDALKVIEESYSRLHAARRMKGEG